MVQKDRGIAEYCEVERYAYRFAKAKDDEFWRKSKLWGACVAISLFLVAVAIALLKVGV